MSKIIGLIMIFGNAYWLGSNIYLYYLYNYTSLLFALMVPTFILVFNSFLAALGIFLGLKVFIKKQQTLKWFLVNLVLVFSGIIIEVIVVSY